MEKSPLIISFDLSSKVTGVAIWTQMGGIDSSSVHIKGNSEMEKILFVRDMVRGHLEIREETHYVYPFIENYAFQGVGRITFLAEIAGVVKLTLHEYTPIAPRLVAPTTLKKWITGKGNAHKDVILQQATLRYGIEFETADEAEAHALADFGSRVMGWVPYDDETKVRQGVVKNYLKKEFG